MINLLFHQLKNDLEISFVKIIGEINEPGDYPFFEGMTVVDLIINV